MKRTPLKRKTPLRSASQLRPAPIAAVSKSRRTKIPRRRQVCDEVRARAGHQCQFLFHVYDAAFSGNPPTFPYPQDCAGPLDVHEIIPRSAWPEGWLEPANCVCVCRRHHEWIGDNPSAAHALHLHGFSYERPDYPKDKQ